MEVRPNPGAQVTIASATCVVALSVATAPLAVLMIVAIYRMDRRR